MNRIRLFISTLIIAILLAPMLGAAAGAHAQPIDSRYFPETRNTVSGRFLEYWTQNGGLMQQGYPISGELERVSEIDGKAYMVQYFERSVFELHPENARPYDVLLSLLGLLSYRENYPNGARNQTPNNDPGSVLFAATDKRVGGSFLNYFNEHGGIIQQGLPISDEFQEQSALDGRMRTVQYFERAVFEWNPSNEPPFNVLLSQLGTFAFRSGGAPNFPEPVIPARHGQYAPKVSGHYLVWNEGSVRNGSGPIYGSFDLHGLDLLTNRPLDVATAPGDQWSFDVSGSLVAWRSEDNGCTSCPTPGVYAKDLATGTQYEIALKPILADKPAVSGRMVAWVQSGADGQVILAKDIDTGTVVQVAGPLTEEPFVTSLQAGDGFFVWSESVYNQTDDQRKVSSLKAYAIATGETTTVLSYVQSAKAPKAPNYSITGHKLVVNDVDGSLFVLDFFTGVKKTLPYNGYAAGLLLSGNLLFFSDSPDLIDINAIDLRMPETVIQVIPPRKGRTGHYTYAVAGDYLIWSDSNSEDVQLHVQKLDIGK
ncbi:MAG: hypothetical protein ABI670_20605 [Chloroflexota bacterium]